MKIFIGTWLANQEGSTNLSKFDSGIICGEIGT